VSPVYCKKFDSIRTKLTEEIHFEVCYSGNLPPIVADRSVQPQTDNIGSVPAGAAAAVDAKDVRIQKCCVRIVPRILTIDPRTGGIRNWRRNRAVKTHRLIFQLVSWSLTSLLAQIWLYQRRMYFRLVVCSNNVTMVQSA